jgi:glutamine synthetase
VTHFEWIRLSFVDVFGALNAMVVPGDRFDEVMSDGIIFDGSALEGRARYFESDLRLIPQRETLIDVGGGVCRVVSQVMSTDGQPWSGDPRVFLGEVVEESGDIGASYQLAPEIEFYLLDDQWHPIDNAGYFDDTSRTDTDLLLEIGKRLRRRNITVASLHHEAGPGQFEVDLVSQPPMDAADAIVLAKQTIREVARDHGVRATFLPLPMSGQPGSGMHVHQRAEGTLQTGGSLTDIGRSFVAGQLAHAAGLCALASPTINSYRRLHSGAEAPSAAIWGHLSRAALIRVATVPGPSASIEYRGSDPSANPYLLAAGLLICGLAGIEEDLPLPPPNDESVGAFDRVESQRFQPLPRDLDEALDSLLADDHLVDAIDSAILTRLIDGRRAETEEFRTHVSDWERRVSGDQD